MRKNKRLSLSVIICMLAISVFTNLFITQTVVYTKSKKSIKSVSVNIDNKNVTEKTVTLTQGKTVKLNVKTKPAKAGNSVKFSTSNKKTATVSKAGKIKAKKAGTAKIKVVVSGKYKKKTTWVKIKVMEVDSEPSDKDTQEEPDAEPSQEEKVLVAYFSRTGENYDVGVIEKGNTAIIADMIAERTGGAEFEITTVNPYPDVYS